MSLYQLLLANGVPIDNHESDLYFPATEETRKLIGIARSNGQCLNITQFRSRIDGALWFDAAFAFEPFWIARAR